MVNTGKDYGLPAEYADWVRNTSSTIPGEHIALMIWAADKKGAAVGAPFLLARFVPPNLPDVGVGGVVRYVDTDDENVRVIRIAGNEWVDQWNNCYTDRDLMADVGDNWFTVELEGL